MKGSKPIRTVEDLLMYLHACPLDAKVLLMPEDGDGYQIGGVLEFNAEKPPQVWLLIDEFADAEEEDISDEQALVDSIRMAESTERPGDMGTIVEEPPKPDVVRIRGKLRSA